MIQRIRRFAAVSAALLAAPALVGAEGSQTFFGNTDVGASFNRPDQACVATAFSVRYQAQTFRVGEAATCSIYSAQDYDGYIHLYQGEFDPADPAVNCVAGNDDDNPAPNLGIGVSVLKGLELVPGATYTLVTSGFFTGDAGAFSNTIHCGAFGPEVLTVQPRHGACPITFTGIPADQQICLADRFLVAIDQITNSASGIGTPVRAGSSDTGIFWFYDDRNWEVMVKVLNGCPINNRFWVFGGALTNQGYRLRVADGRTFEVNTYTNPLGTRAPALTDVQAFPCN